MGINFLKNKLIQLSWCSLIRAEYESTKAIIKCTVFIKLVGFHGRHCINFCGP